tara:strand:+ start:1306 stop:2115 length:810 start_codon:yes stop_codon:yes gene_type:complete
MTLDFVQISLLSILQGITEFLPISSSGHLILPSILLGWDDQGLTFDVAVHIGSLIAVLLYFRSDIKELFGAWIVSLGPKGQTENSTLAWYLIVATIPAGVVGLLLNDWVEQYARSLPTIATTSIIFAGLLYWSDHGSKKNLSLRDLTWRTVMLIGFAQVLALIPGTSRSGITMTTALLCDLNRESAAKFSFLLAVPIIVATGLLKSIELVNSPQASIQLLSLAYAITLSAVVAWTCIHFFLQLINRIGFLPFVIYRVILGLLLFLVYFS